MAAPKEMPELQADPKDEESEDKDPTWNPGNKSKALRKASAKSGAPGKPARQIPAQTSADRQSVREGKRDVCRCGCGGERTGHNEEE